VATLELYLVRHGVAADRGEDYPDDAKRPLTAGGISRMGKVTKGLAAMGVSFDVILTSPLVRTRQTADILAQGLPGSPAVRPTDALAPAGTTAGVLKELGQHMRMARIALVGHEPNIGELAATLIGARAPLPFKKGAVCRIDFEIFPPKGVGSLIWFATPKMLRSLR
jgi:phosphohistidine phosphatase